MNTTDQYVSTVEDKSIMELHGKICELKKSREWEADYMRMAELLERSKREGKLECTKEIVFSFLDDKGGVSADVREKIENEKDVSKLDAWVKLAASAQSIEEFEKDM